MSWRAAGFCLCSLVAGCVDEDWTFRARDAGAAMRMDLVVRDGVVEAAVDRTAPTTDQLGMDVASEGGVTAVDGALDAEASDVTRRDVSELDELALDVPLTDRLTEDAPEAAPGVDVFDAGTELDAARDVAADDGITDAAGDVQRADTGPPTLRAQGVVTLDPSAASVGALRLRRAGFESAGRVCVGTRCLTGGISP